MSETGQVIARGEASVLLNYARLPVVMERGEGSYLWDREGRRYIDLFAGFGGGIVGHAHPDLVRAVTEQARRLWHVGNQFWTEPQIRVAEHLKGKAFDGRAFFCHSGLEANEAAVKLSRLRGKEKGRWKIVSLNKSFHGRSLAMISATGNPKTKAGFEPMVPGFTQVEAGDFEALKGAVDVETCGIILEPIQGEGGVNHYPTDYPKRVRALCDERGLTMIFDEVWTGCGRTGKWFGHQHLGVEPDVMTLGKAAGGGLPVGVMYAKPELAKLMVPGTHGCTLGGNPICMAAAAGVFDVIEKGDLLAHATEMGALAVKKLQASKAAGKIAEIRGKGLFIGLELKEQDDKVVERGIEKGIVINLTAGKVIRLAPAMTIGRELWAEGLERVVEVIAG
jgi:acetylornithine/N-succinyldiaminopimelate aminotransferase